MEKNKKGLIITVIALIGLIVITAGVTYAFFNYAKHGTTDNTVTTGTITFLYTEVSGVGKGISIKDAYPVSDSVGKAQTGEGKVFDFKVTSTTPNNANIPYEITARKKETSTLDEEAVRIYLTKVSGDNEEEVLLDNYSNLTPTTKVDSSKYTEKTLYKSKVTSNNSNYEQAYRLRMWIDEEVDFSYDEENKEYPYNDKEFTVTVNVYANAKVVTEEDIILENNATISSIRVEETTAVAVEGKDYDYEMNLPEDTTSTSIEVTTKNPYATVTVEKLDNLAYETTNAKRLSVRKTLDLNPGDNYFKITVTSENRKVENKFILKIYVDEGIPTLSREIFSKYTTIYENPTLTDSSNNTSDASGLYKSTATNSGDPTYYFRGNVENYLDFAGFTWRVVRINEDGTIRIVLQKGINDNVTYKINSAIDNKDYMYYTNGDIAKKKLENWYSSKIASNEAYANRVATGEYYCEAAKIAYTDTYASNSGASMTVYTAYENPNFECKTDGNTKGLVNASVGLLSYDEVLHAGGYFNKANSSYYLYTGTTFWTMSPSGFSGSYALDWYVTHTGNIVNGYVDNTHRLRPVLNLKADTAVTGLGTSDSHWSVSN